MASCPLSRASGTPGTGACLPTEGEVSIWIVCEVEGVGVIIELTRGFSALFTLLAPHYGL
jgi:hypothetical protein